MRGGGQTGDREMKLGPAGQTLAEKSILHHPFHPAPLPHLYISLSVFATVSFSPAQIIHNLFFNVFFFFLCICSMAFFCQEHITDHPHCYVVELWYCTCYRLSEKVPSTSSSHIKQHVNNTVGVCSPNRSGDSLRGAAQWGAPTRTTYFQGLFFYVHSHCR